MHASASQAVRLWECSWATQCLQEVPGVSNGPADRTTSPAVEPPRSISLLQAIVLGVIICERRHVLDRRIQAFMANHAWYDSCQRKVVKSHQIPECPQTWLTCCWEVPPGMQCNANTTCLGRPKPGCGARQCNQTPSLPSASNAQRQSRAATSWRLQILQAQG